LLFLAFSMALFRCHSDSLLRLGASVVTLLPASDEMPVQGRSQIQTISDARCPWSEIALVRELCNLLHTEYVIPRRSPASESPLLAIIWGKSHAEQVQNPELQVSCGRFA